MLCYLFLQNELKLYVGDCSDEAFIEGLKVVRYSKRSYKQLFIDYVKKSWFQNELFLDVLKQLSKSVTALATDSVNFPTRRDLVNTLRMFTQLKRLQLKMVDHPQLADSVLGGILSLDL